MKTELTADRLRAVVHFDPLTGAFTRRVLAYSVRIHPTAKLLHSKGYLRFEVEGRRYYAQRLAWLYVHGVWPEGDIDHLNHDRADNRIANLRDVSRSVNMENQIAARSNNRSSGVLGVSWHKKARKWSASIQVDGRPRYLGLFMDIDAASAAYVSAKREMHAGCTL